MLIGGISLIAILLADPDGLASQNTRLGHRMLARVPAGRSRLLR